MLAGCAAFLSLYASQGVLRELADDFRVNAERAGLTIAATTLAVALVAPFVGRLTRGYARPRVIAWSSMLLAAPMALSAHASSFAALLLWRFASGVLIPVVFASTVAFIGERWEPRRITEVTSLYVTGTVVGGFAGRFIAALVTAYADWHRAFEALAAASLLVGLVIRVLLADGQPHEAHDAHEARDAAVDRREAGGGGAAASLFGGPLVAAYAVGFCVLFAQVASFTYASLYLGRPPFSLGPAALGSIYAVFLLALVVTPVAGRVARSRPQSQLLLAASLLGALGSLVTLSHSLAMVLAGLALSSSGVFVAQAAATSFVTSSSGAAKATAIGIYLSCYYLGGSLGAIVPGAVWARFGWPGCVALVVLVQCACPVVAHWGWRARPPHSTRQSNTGLKKLRS
ncbi:MFS transporter [Paraburkholderia caballeronis]|uniref:Predicted arabinose efflux permease, MFS family n=1 Tax=Paraburkholderia caballeronis TaxID=416943 RepID=A0A1H7LRK8_9BURK|nr:MFS transporter [Paraburkholderia caballeronis]PXW28571.1 putative MFS family arabinose efflux permease [Paraburkholderia caballeronis]PXX03937.1 putative MFS family arabinose efflux permease [Paraburkholderia caballeronis]RAK04681.1 putative MFS family arabinose efflux permease [Paraburkholderia caballeronis]SED69865.1 Predicted arabinose efflux permease, MFS family [Paraburkholderia caballeronis]SEL01560.1 Predicted arabinose efflux permease, MFS family [Paraburkholderia caballeronis]